MLRVQSDRKDQGVKFASDFNVYIYTEHFFNISHHNSMKYFHFVLLYGKYEYA